MTAPACPRSSQPSHGITGVTAGGETLRLPWLIRVLRLIEGTGTQARSRDCRNALTCTGGCCGWTEAADVAVAAPSPRLVARRPRKQGPGAHAPRRRPAGVWGSWRTGPGRGGRANSARRLRIEAAVDL